MVVGAVVVVVVAAVVVVVVDTVVVGAAVALVHAVAANAIAQAAMGRDESRTGSDASGLPGLSSGPCPVLITVVLCGHPKPRARSLKCGS